MISFVKKVIRKIKTLCDVLLGTFWAYYYTLRYNRNGNVFVCHARLRNCKMNINGKNHRIIIEGGTIRNTKFEISGMGNQVIMDKNVNFVEGGRIRLQDNNNLVHIGENSLIVDCFFALSDNGTKVIVGKDCLFSAKIIIRTSDAHSIVSNGKRINPGKDVLIGDHVWVGYGANILKGSVIDGHSIIGTQSVCAGLHVPEGCVACGNPAKIVKQDIDWSIERLSC